MPNPIFEFDHHKMRYLSTTYLKLASLGIVSRTPKVARNLLEFKLALKEEEESPDVALARRLEADNIAEKTRGLLCNQAN